MIDDDIMALRSNAQNLRDTGRRQFADRLDRVLDELERMKRDAARYRWLVEDADSLTVCDCDDDGDWRPISAPLIDSAIDDAMGGKR